MLNGSKSWITHGGRADFYTLFARTGEGSRGISCFLIPGDLVGLSFGEPEEKMGLHAVPTTSAYYDRARIDADRLIGAEGQGLQIAFSALDSGRLGIAAVAVGVAQAALDEATRYANERTTFGRKIIDPRALASCWPTWPRLCAPTRPILMPRADATWTGRIHRRLSTTARTRASRRMSRGTTSHYVRFTVTVSARRGPNVDPRRRCDVRFKQRCAIQREVPHFC